ncbi:hypothetical protein BaRGS_00031167 [Batillaria attramentaria]|uniref:Glycosyltransferase family 92 protein n=1 Tax=Batillaria attramentaria TaxID=370345 RepID=A0ABD0JRJ4_9CAEN
MPGKGNTMCSTIRQWTGKARHPRTLFFGVLLFSVSLTTVLYLRISTEKGTISAPPKPSTARLFQSQGKGNSIPLETADPKNEIQDKYVHSNPDRNHAKVEMMERPKQAVLKEQVLIKSNSNVTKTSVESVGQSHQGDSKEKYALPKDNQANKAVDSSSKTRDRILYWDDDPFDDVTPHWQRLDYNSDAFVYAAHYDDMESVPVIRVVGLARKPLQYREVWCAFHRSNGEVVDSHVLGKLYHFRWRNCSCYVGAFVVCPLTHKILRPYAVSVNKEEHSMNRTFLKVHYSRELDSAALRRKNTSGETSDKLKKRDSYKWNITRCFPAFQNRYNEFQRAAEMVAASRALGVDHFVFYVESIGPGLKKMLEVLTEDNLAEVYPWNLHLSAKEVHYKAQFSAIQDCLYRHLHSSRYLQFGDVDELIVPRSHDQLLPFLDEHFAKNPSCGAFLFRNAFFNMNFPPKFPPTDEISASFLRGHRMPMLLHTTRHKYIHRAGDRSKPIVDPRKVSVGSVHIVEKLRKGFRSCNVDPEQGLLHHYRYAGNIPENNRTEDERLWRHVDVIENFADLKIAPAGNAARQTSQSTQPDTDKLVNLYAHILPMTSFIKDIPSYKYIFVSAASTSHYTEMQGLVLNLVRNVFPRVKNYTFILVDLGLGPKQRNLTEKYCRCTVLDFPFHLLPQFFKELKCATWKPFVIRSLIDKAEFVIWMDTSVRWSAVSPLDPVFQRAKERGLQLREVNSGVISVRTTASTFDFYGDMTCQYTRFSEIESGAGIYHNEEFVREVILDPWVSCAFDTRCMCVEKYRKLLGCSASPPRRDNRCHRFDQSSLGIIVSKLFLHQRGKLIFQAGSHKVARGHTFNWFKTGTMPP